MLVLLQLVNCVHFKIKAVQGKLKTECKQVLIEYECKRLCLPCRCVVDSSRIMLYPHTKFFVFRKTQSVAHSKRLDSITVSLRSSPHLLSESD